MPETDAAGLTTAFAYDRAGNLLARTLPNGAQASTEFDSMNRPVSQINFMGGETKISYDIMGRITSVTSPLGAVTAYTYDALGNLLTATDGLGAVTTYTYDALNRVVKTVDPRGAVTAYEYDSVGNLAAVIDALGNKTAYAYDAGGNLVGITDAAGRSIAMAYDKNGNATAAIQKNGGVLASAYDKAGRVIAETDPNGNTTKYAYNKNGLTATVTDALGQKAAFEYDALGNVVKITAPGKAVTLYEYDAAGRVLSTAGPEGLKTEYAYNAMSQINGTTVNGNSTQYEYDLAGNITAVTDAMGRRVQFAYDLAGNLLETIYPDGSKDTVEYDLLGRVITSTPRTGLSTAYAYDENGSVTAVTQGEKTTRYAYDLLGRLKTTTAPDGSESTYVYDALGNVISQTDPLGAVTQYQYTAESLLEKVTFANGSTQGLTYDLAGNVLTQTDGEGNTKQFQYDKLNRLSAVVDEAGSKTAYAYDTLDNIAKVTDALKRVTKYTYDKNGSLLSETDPLGNKVQYAYTPEGWLQSITKADGTVLTYTYDKTGSLLMQSVGEGQSISNEYNEIGQVTRVSSPEGDITYQYDGRGYLISVENVNGDVVKYTYDEYGNKTGMTYPDSRTVAYGYDSMNRLISVVGLDGKETTYTYDAAGRRVETKTEGDTKGSTLTTVYHYDSVGNLLKQATQGPVDISFAYSYNKNNAITREERVEGEKATATTYAYDALGQLTAFASSTGYGEAYTYDAVGNMLKKAITPAQGAQGDAAAVTLKMSYNKGNQLVLVANGKDKLTYAYDKNGSMVEKVLQSKEHGKLKDTYAYNSRDQLIGYTGYDGYQQTFTYDASGMRLAKAEKGDTNRSTLEELLRGNIAGLPEVVAPKADAKAEDAAQAEEGYAWATTEYVYDITQAYYQVIQEKTTGIGGSFTSAYAYGLERIAAYEVSPNGESSKTSYVYDGRGSVAQTITAPQADESVLSALPNVQVASFQYTAFGEQMNTAVKVSGFTYNAEQYDAATGLLNLRARQYEPAMNRFSQKDKLRGSASSPLSLNRYAYVQNDPVNLIDPSGMRLVDMQVNGEYYSEEEFHQKVDNLRSAANAALKAGNQQEADKLASRAMSFMDSGYDYLTPAQKQAYSKAKSQLATASDPEERKRIIREACMSPQELEAQKQQEAPVQAEPTLADYWNAALYNNNRRLNEMLNAPTLTSILNYFSYGALEANAARYEAAQEDQSFYAWGNWASSGYFDSVNGALNAEKPLSFEHWMDSLSAAMPVMIISGYGTYLGSSTVTPKDLILHGDKFGAVPYGSNLPLGTVGDALGVSEGAGKSFGPINKGPLSDAVANTFRSGTYEEVVTQGETTLYRVHGGKAGEIGSYWTTTKPQGPLQSVIDSALDQSWGNTAINVSTIKVPTGTTIYQGYAAPQGGLVGGGVQVYIPEVNPAWLVK